MGNHLLYNFGVGGGAGADLYGTEPWTFYAKLPGLGNSRGVNRILEAMLINMGVSENVVYPIVPNGFADHYPVFKWLFHWED